MHFLFGVILARTRDQTWVFLLKVNVTVTAPSGVFIEKISKEGTSSMKLIVKAIILIVVNCINFSLIADLLRDFTFKFVYLVVVAPLKGKAFTFRCTFHRLEEAF